eukprot:scaffold9903_cov106-Isochrysis_galbana.AAC.2
MPALWRCHRGCLALRRYSCNPWRCPEARTVSASIGSSPRAAPIGSGIVAAAPTVSKDAPSPSACSSLAGAPSGPASADAPARPVSAGTCSMVGTTASRGGVLLPPMPAGIAAGVLELSLTRLRFLRPAPSRYRSFSPLPKSRSE